MKTSVMRSVGTSPWGDAAKVETVGDGDAAVSSGFADFDVCGFLK